MNQAITKTLVFFIVLILTAAPALAGCKLEKGIKAGLSITNFSGAITEYEPKTGFSAGGFAGYKLNAHIRLQIEALFVMKGAVKDTSAVLSEKIGISYVEIPLLVKVVIPTRTVEKPSYYSTDKSLSPYFCAGPAIGIKLSGEYHLAVDTIAAKAMDIGLAFGGGLDIELGKGSLVVDMRYTLGLSEVTEDHDFATDNVTFVFRELKNRSLTILVGYGF